MNVHRCRILIADDHPVVRMGLRLALDSLGTHEVVGEAESGEEALYLCQKLQPNLVLLDLKMAGIGGVTAARTVRENYPEVRIIALTSFADSDVAQATIAAGVHGFLFKDITPEQLAQAIDDVLAGKTVISPEVHRFLQPVEANEAVDDGGLGAQQMKVLFYVTKGLTNKEIASQMDISVATVRYHVGIILDKLGASNRTEASARAIAQNLLMDGSIS